ncbi:MAG: alpha/beta fold hydrolase [Smithellaceae bacterium]|nr:alpha/beta fold hydrolase [Smithellaceae bacterium]
MGRDKQMILKTEDGVRLLGYYTPTKSGHPKGVVVLIHGWEGSSSSAYMISTGFYLHERDYDVFRLNLRDHGNSHHLNNGLFHGALIDETFSAVAQIAFLNPMLPCFLIGFSLGGNFALRIASHDSVSSRIPSLNHIFAVSPALDPYKTTLAIDHGPLVYRRYFLKKWKASLLKKQQLYPEIYDFSYALRFRTCMEMTEALMPYYPDFPTVRDYFYTYTITDDSLRSLALPVTVIASVDDPVIPPDDLLTFRKNQYLDIQLQKHGGHCGFLNPFPHGCWYERWICEIMERKQ